MSQPVKKEVFELTFKDYQNPYEELEIARKEHPVLWSTIPLQANTSGKPSNFWLVTDYNLTQAGLREPKLIKDPRSIIPKEKWPKVPDALKPLANMQRLFMLFRDPPDHTRLRRLVSKPFTPRLVAKLDPRIEGIAKDLIDDMCKKETADLFGEYAFTLPVIVIAELLGIPDKDREKFKVWSKHIQKNVGSFSNPDRLRKRSRFSRGNL